MHSDDGGVVWGYLRRPALLTPLVAALSLAAIEALKSRPEISFAGTDWVVLALFGTFSWVVFVTVFGLIPMLLGAVLLLAVCSALPGWLTRIAALRIAIGGLMGCLIGLPFTYLLNFIPSAGAEPRFSYLSMLFTCVVSGGFCAAFYSEAPADVSSDKLPERTHGR